MRKESGRSKDNKGNRDYEKPALTKYKKISEWIRSGTTDPIVQGQGGGE